MLTAHLASKGKDVTLTELFAETLGTSGGVDACTTDLLDVEATARVFQRFDNFNDSCVK